MATSDWTPARDARLRRLRAEGARWHEIAADLGVSPDIARERGRRIAAPRPPATMRPLDDPARPPLPAGHPRTWRLLTEGTLLADCDWPAPEAPERRQPPLWRQAA